MRALLLLIALTVLCAAAQADDPNAMPVLPPRVHVPDAAQPGPDFDVDKATEAYLALLTPEQRARSDRYFEGGYWVDFFESAWSVAICLLMLRLAWSTAIR